MTHLNTVILSSLKRARDRIKSVSDRSTFLAIFKGQKLSWNVHRTVKGHSSSLEKPESSKHFGKNSGTFTFQN